MPRRSNAPSGFAPLVVLFVLAVAGTFIIARWQAPESWLTEAVDQELIARGHSELLDGLADVIADDELVAAVAGHSWTARVVVSGDESGDFTLGAATTSSIGQNFSEEPWQYLGVAADVADNGGPIDVTIGFRGADATYLRVVARDTVLGEVVSDPARSLIILDTPDHQYSASKGECDIELVHLDFAVMTGWVFATRGRDVIIPAMVGTFDCTDVIDRDGTSTISIRGAFAFDRRVEDEA